jgi:hypothetical protein
MTADEQHLSESAGIERRTHDSDQGAAEQAGIVDQQDAVLHEMERHAEDDANQDEGVNDTERRYGKDESPA